MGETDRQVDRQTALMRHSLCLIVACPPARIWDIIFYCVQHNTKQMLFNSHRNVYRVLSSDVFVRNSNLVIHNALSSLETSIFSATATLYQFVFRLPCFSWEVQKPSIKFNSLIEKTVLYNAVNVYIETPPPKWYFI